MTYLTPVLFGLLAAVAWGAADFTGGVASRRANVFRVVIGAEAVGIALLLPAAIILHEPFPSIKDLAFAAIAGLAGGFGLVLLYKALASGQMSVAAPISALGGALTPVIVGFFLEGLPSGKVIAGIGLALLAIFLVSYNADEAGVAKFRLEQLKLPGLAGLCFGLFIILLHQSSQEGMFWPVLAVRISSVTLLTILAATTHQTYQVDKKLIPIILLSGLFDTAGNILYVIAGQLGRLDVAAVLSSLYPAVTVALAFLFLKERITILQWIGVLIVFIAITLFVL